MLRTAMLMSIIATLCAGLSGCGLKGDLYMPRPDLKARARVAAERIAPQPDRPHAEQTTSQQSGR